MPLSMHPRRDRSAIIEGDGGEMAYDPRGVFETVCRSLEEAPLTSLGYLSQKLKIERHTIEKSVRRETGCSFRELKKQFAFAAALDRLRSRPTLSIKEISYELGYCSPRSFSRFVRSFSGRTPRELRFETSLVQNRH